MKKVIGIAALGLITMAFVINKNTNHSNGNTNDKSESKKQSTIENRESGSLKEGGEGIKFKNISLAKAKENAAESGQLIFIEAHTSWDGPSKKMAATSFMNEEVGELFNEKFINLKIDCEKDADGPEISRMYKILAYPTLLIIDSEGKLIKQVVGFQTEDRLISLANSVD